MKPDWVATTPAEPPEDVVELVPEAAANEELVQQDLSPSSTQPENPENQGKPEGANATLEKTSGKEVNGKFSKPKDKTKAPVKTKPGTAGIKATTTIGAASRFATAESRAANGVKKTASVCTSKKPASMTAEMKSAPVGAFSQVKKVPTATTVASRTPVKAAEQKVVGSTRPVASTSSLTRKTAAATSQALRNKPVAGGSNASVKPKTTAPRTTTVPAAKTSVPDGSKAASMSKTTRFTVATASRPATSSAPVRLTTTASKSTALRTVSSVSSQPSKVSTTVEAKKDISTTTSAAARKLLASTTTRSTAPKASKPEPPKPAAAAKRLPTNSKTSQQKAIKAQVPTRKVPPSPRNISSHTALGRTAADLSNHKQGVSSNPVSVKVQTAKPTQSVLPLVIKEKPSEKQFSRSVEPSAIIETTAAIAPVESVIEAQALVEGQAEVPALAPINVDPVSDSETTDAESLVIQSVSNVPVPSEMVHDYVFVVAPTAQEMNGQEHVTASPCKVPVTVQMPSRDLEVVEKQEPIIRNLEEEEDEEKEGSQQVSVSDMSGTQPTEESRPGSAGLAGSLWRAGGLPSEFDSEDVSCSQHGASELSAPGVLEGTESMDDLGEASLKGADEGASAGSPDFEKFPDIPVNEDYDEDDDDEDRVDDMDVGSEMTEDPHRQCNDNEDEDEDVEMASEGVTESGLESYGNADEDDLTEDYRLDNLNRMQSLQPDPALVSSPASIPWQTYPELPNQPATEACLDVKSAKTDLSSLTIAVLDSFPSSTQLSLESAAEMGMDHKQDLAPNSKCISQSNALLGPELTDYACSGASTHDELNDHIAIENQKQLLPVSPIPLGECGTDHAGSEHEEPETLPADDMLAGLSTVITSAPSPYSTATRDEASDMEGDMLISDTTEPGSTGNECLDTHVAQSMSTLVEECEEVGVEMEGGGGETPQSATSAASYGFEGTNSNAQSTTESCIKSPGIFSLENEEHLPDETKEHLVIKELSREPVGAPADSDQQGECQLNSEQQYMHCGKVSDKLPETTSLRDIVPSEPGLDSSSSSEHQRDLDLNAPHPYYSTICEKTDSFLTGRDLCVPQQEKVPTFTTSPPKHHSGLRVDHVTRLPTDLPPRMPNVGCNAQLRRLEQHQQQLAEIEQRREQQNLIAEGQKEEKEVMKSSGKNRVDAQEREREQKCSKVNEREEEQRRYLLHLQIQQQQQELKQRQQIMQWQQELEQRTAQGKHQNSHHKNLSTALLSPSGLCTIYEALETSDSEEDNEDKIKENEMVLKIKVAHECSSKERSSISSDNPDSSQPQGTPPFPNCIDHERFTHSVTLDSPPLPETSTSQPLSSLELDWSKKTDIVQQLINQTLLLNGDKCSPLLLLPGGAAGTLSPLETSLWPNLPQMTPLSATVTSVSSYSAELAGSVPQGEWTVVELETHH